jgi:hypothetical protein
MFVRKCYKVVNKLVLLIGLYSTLLITIFSGLNAFNYIQGEGYKVTRFLIK